MYSAVMGFRDNGALPDASDALGVGGETWRTRPTRLTRHDYEVAAQAAFAMEQLKRELLAGGSVNEEAAKQAGARANYWRREAMASPFLGVEPGTIDALGLGKTARGIADSLARSRAKRNFKAARQAEAAAQNQTPVATAEEPIEPSPAPPSEGGTDTGTVVSEPQQRLRGRLARLRRRLIGEPADEDQQSPAAEPEPTPVSTPEPLSGSAAILGQPTREPRPRTQPARPTRAQPGRTGVGVGGTAKRLDYERKFLGTAAPTVNDEDWD